MIKWGKKFEEKAKMVQTYPKIAIESTSREIKLRVWNVKNNQNKKLANIILLLVI